MIFSDLDVGLPTIHQVPVSQHDFQDVENVFSLIFCVVYKILEKHSLAYVHDEQAHLILSVPKRKKIYTYI